MTKYRRLADGLRTNISEAGRPMEGNAVSDTIDAHSGGYETVYTITGSREFVEQTVGGEPVAHAMCLTDFDEL